MWHISCFRGQLTGLREGNSNVDISCLFSEKAFYIIKNAYRFKIYARGILRINRIAHLLRPLGLKYFCALGKSMALP